MIDGREETIAPVRFVPLVEGERMKREFSAGGVVLRGDEVAVVSPAPGRARPAQGPPGRGRDAGAGGHPRGARGDRAWSPSRGSKLGEVRYWYTLHGERVLKSVTFFLFDYVSGSVEDHDDEVESASWIPLEQAPELLSYKGEREMAQKALERAAT